MSYTVAGQANLSRSLERNAELQVQLDKPAYSGGDTIDVSIRAPYVGAGLITIERERVFHHQWFKTTTTSSVQRVMLPADFEGNGYVNVQFLRDPASDELFMSPLSYGVAPFAPNLAARTQPVTSDRAAAQVKPGDDVDDARRRPAKRRASPCWRWTRASCRSRATGIQIRSGSSSRSGCWKSRPGRSSI